MNDPTIEFAARRMDSATCFKRMAQAGKRLLADAKCDACHLSPVMMVNGAGVGWCSRCGAAAVIERRDGFERLEAARAAVDAARRQVVK